MSQSHSGTKLAISVDSAGTEPSQVLDSEMAFSHPSPGCEETADCIPTQTVRGYDSALLSSRLVHRSHIINIAATEPPRTLQPCGQTCRLEAQACSTQKRLSRHFACKSVKKCVRERGYQRSEEEIDMHEQAPFEGHPGRQSEVDRWFIQAIGELQRSGLSDPDEILSALQQIIAATRSTLHDRQARRESR